MIVDKSDLLRYLEADLRANGLTFWRWQRRFSYPISHWLRHLRRVEFIKNTYTAPWQKPYVNLRVMLFRHHSIKLGYNVPLNVFGPGLSVPHWGTIVVAGRARVGANCRIHPGVCLGTKNEAAPQLGDNCYLGPGAKLFGGIRLGNRVKVGANAVVNRDFPDDAVLVGVPATNIAPTRQPLLGAAAASQQAER